jgi:ABC-2 type transport system permease protein
MIMPAADLAPNPAPPAVPASTPAFRQVPVAWRFALRNQARNRLAWLLLIAFVPVRYELMADIAGHTPLTFKLYATGRVLTVDGGHLTLITAGLNAVTMIVGFAVFAAIRRTLAFDKRLVFAGYRQATLITAKTLAIAVVAAAVAGYTSLVLLAFWRAGLAGWAAVAAGFTVIALAYGAFGLLLGVLVRNDLEGFFLIIMGSLMDTFLQNPLGNPLANKPVLEWFPSFGPTQFAVAGSLGHTALRDHLALGLAWPGPPPSPPSAWSSSGPGPAPGPTTTTDQVPEPPGRTVLAATGIWAELAASRPGTVSGHSACLHIRYAAVSCGRAPGTWRW